MLFGFISAESSERQTLVDLGVQLGRYDRGAACYRDCIVPDEAEDELRALYPRVLAVLDELDEGEG